MCAGLFSTFWGCIWRWAGERVYLYLKFRISFTLFAPTVRPSVGRSISESVLRLLSAEQPNFRFCLSIAHNCKAHTHARLFCNCVSGFVSMCNWIGTHAPQAKTAVQCTRLRFPANTHTCTSVMRKRRFPSYSDPKITLGQGYISQLRRALI